MKKYIFKYFVLVLLFSIFSIKGFAQKDTVFWFSAPETNRYHSQSDAYACAIKQDGTPVYLHLTTFEYAANVTISMPANPFFTPIVLNIPANTTHREDLSNHFEDGVVNQFTSMENKLMWTTSSLVGPTPFINKGTKGIKISSDRVITAYYEIGVQYNMDLISLKGNNALGTQFFVPFQTTHVTRAYYCDYRPYSSIDIVATEDNTQILVTTDKAIWVKDGVPVSLPAGVHTLWLDKGETSIITPYENVGGPGYQTSFDMNARLAGAYVESSAPISIITHDDIVRSNNGLVWVGGAWVSNPDYVTDQIVPIDHIGTDYAVIQGVGYDVTPPTLEIEDYTYVVGTVAGTNFTVKRGPGGATTNHTVGVGETVAIPMDDLTKQVITIKCDDSDKPIYVYHMSGAGRQKAGAIIPTISTCTGSYKVAFNRTKDSPYAFYLNILVRKNAIGSFRLMRDNADVTDAGDLNVLALINNPAQYDDLPETGDPYDKWSYARINADDLDPNVAYLLVNDVNFYHLGVINGQTGADAFYGYFSNFNEIKASAVEVSGQSAIGQVCEGDTFQLEAEGGTAYEWTPHDYLDDPFSPTPKAVLPAGNYDYFVHVTGDCVDTTIRINLDCLPKPEAFFTLSEYSGCAPLEVTMQNQSSGSSIFRWDFTNNASWDLETNDPNGTVVWTYDNSSPNDTVFSIRMLAKEHGIICTDEFTNTLQVFPRIEAGFTVDNMEGCNPLLVNFTDTSISPTQVDDEYIWVFGDGPISNAHGDTAHTYSHFNTTDTVDYNVELQLTSPYYCRDTARKTISVFPYLEAGFTIDEDDGCSPLDVRIENVTSGADSIFLAYGDGNIDTLFNFISVTHRYVNNDGVDEVDTNVIAMRIKNDEGCERFWYDTVLVYPEITADYSVDGDNYEGCNSRNVIFTNNSNDGVHIASRYLWEFADGTAMDTTNNTINKFYNNTTTANKTYDFRLTARSIYGCTDDTTNTITIYRAYANFTVDNNEGCSPLPVNVSNISIGDDIPITGWDWDYGDGVGTSTDENPFQYIYNNLGVANDTNYLVLQVTESVGGCSTKDTVEIIVYPEVQVSYVENHITVPSCDSLVVEFNSTIVNAALPNVTYEWNFGDGSSSSTADTVHAYRNLTKSTPESFGVNLRVETDMGCYDEASSNIIVNPKVDAKFFIDKSSGCSPIIVDVLAQSYPGISNYNWDYGDGIGTSTFPDPTPYPYPANQSYLPQPGGDAIYELILEVDGSAGACTDSDTVDVVIYSEILADYTTDVASGCNPLIVNFTDNSSANAVSWQWDFDDGSTSSSQNTQNTFVNPNPFIQPFDVTLDVISDRGCTNSVINQINVLPYVESDFDINISEGCSPLTVTITNNSLSSGTEWYWYWDKDDNTIDAGVIAAADSAVNFASFTKTFYNNSGSSRTDSLTLIVGNGNGCYRITKKAVTVHTEITAEFTVNPVSQEGCNPLNVDFTNTNILPGGKYTWTFGDGSSSPLPSPSHLFTNTGIDDKTFTVRLQAESAEGCTDNAVADIVVYSKVISGFSIATSEGCPPFTTTIDNTSIGNSTNTYQWLIDNVVEGTAPTDDSDFDHLYENITNSVRDYEVKLIATNPHGCTSEHVDTVTVYEYLEASFSMDIDEGCTPLNIQFTDQSYVPTSTKYIWKFGDGASSGLSNPSHIFYNSSRTADLTRTVNLTVQSLNYCSDDTSLTVDIYHQPLANFFIDKTSSCPPLLSTLSKLSEGEDMFEWRFGDGNTNTVDSDLEYSWDNTDIDNIQYYNMELWVGTINNCKDSMSFDLSVFPKVVADYTINNSAGCSPLVDVQFTNASTSPATQFFWSFGDGSTTNQENPIHDFVNIGITDRTYDVFFRAYSEYNCWDTITKQIDVFVQPDAEFYIDPVLMTFPDNIVSIDNRTNTGPFDYYWEFGDMNLTTSTNEEPGQFEYEHWGEKVMELSVTSNTNSNCFDYYTDTVIVLPPKVNADFTTNIDGGCINNGLEVEFTAAGSAYNETYQYDWEFGDGETGSGQYINHTFESPGVYYVKLTARSNEYTSVEEDYAYKTIRVYSNPIAYFEVVPNQAMLNEDQEARVEFYNLSECSDTAGCSYLWQFGDDETSIAKDVTHNYTDLGFFDVMLTVVSAHGCRDSLLKPKEVEIIGAGKIVFPNAFTPHNKDGLNDIFRPVSEGVIEYELLIYNRWGELIFKTNDLNQGWDGNMNGDPSKADVYVWKAVGKFTNGKVFELAGDVTLIR